MPIDTEQTKASVAYCQGAFIGWITSPDCAHCGSGEETAEHLRLSCAIYYIIDFAVACLVAVLLHVKYWI